MSYTRALERLRALVLAHNALTDALNAAIDDVLMAAEQEGRDDAAVSSVRPREPVFSSVLQKRIGSADIERHLRQKWSEAETEEARERVRRSARNAVANGLLDPDAEGRLTG